MSRVPSRRAQASLQRPQEERGHSCPPHSVSRLRPRDFRWRRGVSAFPSDSDGGEESPRSPRIQTAERSLRVPLGFRRRRGVSAPPWIQTAERSLRVPLGLGQGSPRSYRLQILGQDFCSSLVMNRGRWNAETGFTKVSSKPELEATGEGQAISDGFHATGGGGVGEGGSCTTDG
jgi:hypothetical protein